MKKLLKQVNQRYTHVRKALKSEAREFAELSSEEQLAYNEAKISWQAPLYINKVRPWWWSIVGPILIFSLAAYGILANSWQFSIAIVLFGGFYYYFQHQEVPQVQITFSNFGVQVGKKIYDYKMFRTFWIDYNPPFHNEIHLIPNNRYKYELTLFLADQNPEEIQRFLRNHLPEWVDKEKSAMEHIANLTGL